MKRCFEVEPCPASHYLKCPAYKQGKNCWETVNIPCCKRNNKDRCPPCSVYMAAMGKD